MPSKNIHLYIVMILAMISWGASWPAAKIVGQYANPQDLIVWRFAFALVAMLIVMKIFNIPLTFPAKSLKFVVSARCAKY
jgi:EamA-like transporter family.